MHLADAFIQSDLQCIQAIHVLCFTMCVPWESNPQPFALLTQCSTTEPQEHYKCKYPCGAADIEQHTQFASSGYSPKWRYSDANETNYWINRYFYFLCVQKVFSSLHKAQIEPLMADGLFWRYLSYFSGPWQWYLLGSQWDSHKPPGFHPKYVQLCSEDEQSFYGFGTTWG